VGPDSVDGPRNYLTPGVPQPGPPALLWSQQGRKTIGILRGLLRLYKIQKGETLGATRDGAEGITLDVVGRSGFLLPGPASRTRGCAERRLKADLRPLKPGGPHDFPAYVNQATK